MRLFLNMDCMEGMKEYPDDYFDLAIVDPVYGDVTQGSYMFGKGGENKAKRIDYHLGVWNQEKTDREYFKELFRVSKNQIIWGGTTLQTSYRCHKVGLYGIKNIPKVSSLRIVNLHGLRSIKRQGYSDLCGMACYKAI